jgi:TetR/AcrR family transcriptional repressor of nem operon
VARPSSFDRDEAIRIAMQEIWRNGYAASSVKAVSEKLGINRSSYYNAFGSREKLFETVLSAYFEQSPDRVLHRELPDIPIKQLLTHTFREICAARACDPDGRGCLVVNCLAELAGTHESLGPVLADAVVRGANRFQELLEIAVRNGELAAETDTRAKALALQNLMVGINVFSKAVRSEEDLWVTVKTTLEALELYQETENA